MQTHSNNDAAFLDRLCERAEASKRAKAATIAAGKDGEELLAEWQFANVHVRHLPPDEQEILRISIGGGATPVPLNYLTFRGNHGACVDLLRKALTALESGGPA